GAREAARTANALDRRSWRAGMPLWQRTCLRCRWKIGLPRLHSLQRGLPWADPCRFRSRRASMPSYCSPRGCLLFEQALAPFLAGEGLPLARVLPAETIAQAFAEEGVGFGTTKNSVFTPALTLWAFLSQVVHEAKSCHAAVLRVAALLIALARTPCSEDTAAY